MSSPPRRVALATAILPLVLAAAAAGPATASEVAVDSLDAVEAGLAGPVSAVLEDAPDKGRVPLVVTSTDPDGGLSVAREVAADIDHAGDLVREARRDDATLSVSVEREYRAVGTADPGRGEQWALDTLAGEQVWPLSTGRGVQVAVLDSGVDGSHPDLAGALGPGTDLVTPGGTGRTDPYGHGTHVAGIIAARAGNGLGIAGLAPEATVLPVRVLDGNGRGDTAAIARGVQWAVDHGADVINLSLGSDEPDPALDVTIGYARAKGAVVVAAVGNDATGCSAGRREGCGNPVLYPGASEGVVGVGASDAQNGWATFSEHGPQVDVVAPGVDILSTWPGGYATAAGTSMATPFAAATVALLRSSEPALTVAQVEQRLTGTARDLGTRGRDDYFGHGLIQPLAALAPRPAPTTSTPVPVKPVATTTRAAVSRTVVRPGAVVTATAAVSASGRRVSGPAELCVARNTAPSSPRCAPVTVKDGRASLQLSIGSGSIVTARFLGSATHRGSSSAGVRVAVLPQVLVTGGSRRLTVQVTAAQRQRATVQRAERGRWRTVKAFTVVSTGRTTVTGLRPGTYRVTVSASAGLQASSSSSVRVR